ncbi:hypothetical protein FKO01_38800 [Mesorhizobium sp. B2-3-3]|nr:hypothetical protein FKO01_38800 [Mesorhizobium sp. B2-3-3]
MFDYTVRRLALQLAIGTLSLLASGVQRTNGQSMGELFSYPESELSGKVSVQASVPLEQCRSLCSSRSGCLGFDFSSSNGASVCKLFEKVDSAHNSPEHTAGTRTLVAGYPPPSNPPLQPLPPLSQTNSSAPEASDVSGRKVSYRGIPGDRRPIGWVYINVCSGAPVNASALRKSVNDFVFEALRLIPGRIERFDRNKAPQCSGVPKAIGYVSANAEKWRVVAALKEMEPLLRSLGIGARADGTLSTRDAEDYRIEIWLSHL